MNFKIAVVTVSLSGLFLSSLRNCPANSFVNPQNNPSCCTNREKTACPAHQEGTKGTLLCCDQPRAASVFDISSFRFGAFQFSALLTEDHPVVPAHISFKNLPDISVVGPPQRFDRLLPIRAPPV